MPSYKIAGSKWCWAQVQTSPNLRGAWIHIPTLGLGSASKSRSHNLLGKGRPMNCPLIAHWRAAKAACCWTRLLCLPCIASKGAEVKPFFDPAILILAFGLRRTHPFLTWCFNFRIFLLFLPSHQLGQWTEPPGRQKPSPGTVASLGAAQGPGRAEHWQGKPCTFPWHYPALERAQQCLCQPCCATTKLQQVLGDHWHLPAMAGQSFGVKLSHEIWTGNHLHWEW